MRRFSVLPLACYAIMLVYAGYGALVVGHWPYYAHPDPKELPHRVLLQIAAAFMILGAAALVLIPVGYGGWRAVVALGRRPVGAHRREVVVYSAGATLWALDLVALYTKAPWHSVIDWLLD